MVDKAQKTKILMENFNKYINENTITENNEDKLELNRIMRLIYPILKKNGIQTRIVNFRGSSTGNHIDSNKEHDTNKASAMIYMQNQNVPSVRVDINNPRLVSQDVAKSIINQINGILPDTMEIRITQNNANYIGWEIRTKAQNKSEKHRTIQGTRNDFQSKI